MEQKPRMPWIFLGGYFLFFLGLATCFVGAFEFSGARGDPPTNPFFSLSIAGLA